MNFKKMMAMILSVAMVLSIMVTPVAAAAVEFNDVKEEHYYYESVQRWAKADIVNGYTDGDFEPEGYITRGEVAKVMAELLGLKEEAENTFKDLDASKWYAPYVLRCVEAGILNGDDQGNCNAEAPITREQAFAILVRSLKLTGGDKSVLDGFADKDDISDWAIPEVATIVTYKAVIGDDQNNLNPGANIKRCEFVTVLDRLIAVYVDAEGNVSTSTGSYVGNLVVVHADCPDDLFVEIAKNETGKYVVTVLKGETVLTSVTMTNGKTPVVIVAKDMAVAEEGHVVYVVGAEHKNDAYIGEVPVIPEPPVETDPPVEPEPPVETDPVETEPPVETDPVEPEPPVESDPVEEECKHEETTCDPQKFACISEGVDVVCVKCGEVVGHKNYSAGAHDIKIVAGKEATCTESGMTEGKVCNACGKVMVKQEKIEALGHTEVKLEAVAATCTTTGLTEGSKCSVCGEVLKAQETVAALGHDFPECNDPCTEITNCAIDTNHVEECENGCGITSEYIHEATTHDFDENGDCVVCGMNEDDNALKFALEVSSKNGEDTTSVKVNVTNDYAAVVSVDNGTVDASNVTLYAKMQNVGSLGVAGIREHSITVNTGMTADADLSVWLKNAFAFNDGDVHVVVGEYDFTYSMSGATDEETGDATITAEPSDVNEARAAWQELTSHVSTETQTADDSYINIANGSYLVLGGEKLGFEKQYNDDLLLNDFSKLSDMEEQIRAAVRVYDAEDGVIEAYLAAGTVLAVGSSVATLDDNCTITVTGLDCAALNGILGDTRDAASTEAMVKNLVSVFNEVIGAVDAGSNIEVTVSFTEAVELTEKFYLGVSAPTVGSEEDTTVEAIVYDDYSAVINVPMNTIDASEVTLAARMTNVASLGAAGVTKSHEITLNDIVSATPDLGVWLGNVAKFETGTINATIDGKAVTYTLTGDKDTVCTTITATPNSTEAARAAWQALTSHVSTETQTADNSFILIPFGAELTIGKEVLCFEEGASDLLLDNFSNLSGLKDSIKAAVKVEALEEDGGIKIVVPAGAKLAVGSSVAVLDDTCTIIVTGIDTEDSTILSDIRSAASESTYAMIQKLVVMLNNAIGAANGAEVDVAITFGE